MSTIKKINDMLNEDSKKITINEILTFIADEIKWARNNINSAKKDKEELEEQWNKGYLTALEEITTFLKGF